MYTRDLKGKLFGPLLSDGILESGIPTGSSYFMVDGKYLKKKLASLACRACKNIIAKSSWNVYKD